MSAPKQYDFTIVFGPSLEEAKVSVNGKELQGVVSVSMQAGKKGEPQVAIVFNANSIKVQGEITK